MPDPNEPTPEQATPDQLMNKLLEQEELLKRMRQLDPTHRCAKGDVLLFLLGHMIGTLHNIQRANAAFDSGSVASAVDTAKAELMRWVDALAIYPEPSTPASEALLSHVRQLRALVQDGATTGQLVNIIDCALHEYGGKVDR